MFEMIQQTFVDYFREMEFERLPFTNFRSLPD